MIVSPKYPRTFHLPWSKGATNDDKRATSVEGLIGKPIIISDKIDGSNTSLEAEACFARTHSGSPTHPSFDGFKALHAAIKHEITTDTQLFGEWVFARHSIEYTELPAYFLLFGVRYLEEPDYLWGSWEEVEFWSKEIAVPTVPILFQGIISSEKELQELTESLMIQPSVCGGIREGVVVRIADAFNDDDFSSCVMKCVRANHVSPDNDHWKHKEIVKNNLAKK